MSTDASRVESGDLLGIIVDFLLVVHLFQQVDDALEVLDGGTTCTVPQVFSPSSPTVASNGWRNWLKCKSGCSISPQANQEFSVVVHDALPNEYRQTRWPICVGVQEENATEENHSALLYSDQDIVVYGSLVDSRIPHGVPWPEKTVITVRLLASDIKTTTITFAVNGRTSNPIHLPGTADGRWIPTVGIRAGMYSATEHKFIPYTNSISFT